MADDIEVAITEYNEAKAAAEAEFWAFWRKWKTREPHPEELAQLAHVSGSKLLRIEEAEHQLYIAYLGRDTDTVTAIIRGKLPTLKQVHALLTDYVTKRREHKRLSELGPDFCLPFEIVEASAARQIAAQRYWAALDRHHVESFEQLHTKLKTLRAEKEARGVVYHQPSRRRRPTELHL
jgi:hypothetical protein